MSEDFLHYIWKMRLFNADNLKTVSGESIDIRHAGYHNHNAGPDFTEALVKIGDTLWAGHVEIHLRSSDWDAHGHSDDRSYDNVVLHVVYQHDREIFRRGKASAESIPVLELRERIDYGLIRRYKAFLAGRKWIPCQSHLAAVPESVKHQQLVRMHIARLEDRYEEIVAHYRLLGNDLREVYYARLLRSFGFKVNTHSFQELARILPQKLLQKHRHHSLQIEALLFGQAGLLEGPTQDTYQEALQTEYRFLQKKYVLTPMAGHLWKFGRMRPHNFPTVRLAQMAGLFASADDPIGHLLSARDLAGIGAILRRANPSSYWQEHLHFGKPSAHALSGLGSESLDGLLINAVIPLTFTLGRLQADATLEELAIAWSEQLKPEHNSTIKRFADFGLRAAHAGDSQGLLHLYTRYCSRKKCLTCSIGHSVIKS